MAIGDRSDAVASVTREVSPSPWDRARDGRVLALLFLLIWAVYLATAAYTLNQMNDSRETSIAAWNLGVRGTFDMPADWPEDLLRWEVEGVDGQRYTNRFPGPILWGAPFFAVTELVMQRGDPGHPWLLNLAPGGVAAATVTALAMATCFVVFRRLVDRRYAIGAVVALGLGTATWSVAADALWTHGPAMLALALGMLAISSRRHAAGGAAFGAAILARPHLAVVPAVVGIWEGVRARSARPVALVGLTSVLGLVAMTVYSQVMFGTWLPVAGYNPSRIDNVIETSGPVFLERVIFNFAHPVRGILLYTPALLLLLPGLMRAWRVAPAWARSSAVGGVLYFLVQMRANTWHGGYGYFGNRLMLETLVLASPLLLLAFQEFVARSRVRVIAFYLLLAVSIVGHALGATILERGPFYDDHVEYWQDAIAEVCEEQPDLCDSPR